jgi:hypothetical protein
MSPNAPARQVRRKLSLLRAESIAPAGDCIGLLRGTFSKKKKRGNSVNSRLCSRLSGFQCNRFLSSASLSRRWEDSARRLERA